ncbi:MAG: hypothetical protein WDA20_08555 [Desulfuromonadales bacterium]
MEKEHLEILLEDIRAKLDLVLEGHEVLRREIRVCARNRIPSTSRRPC